MTEVERSAEDQSVNAKDTLVAETPQGIVAVLVGPDGSQIATATDFHRGSSSGFDQCEVQTIRAKKALAFASMRALASPRLSNAIDEYMAERIVDGMCRQGCRVVIVPVGYQE